ncbi:hypothetical protein, partial [Lacrimispora sp.]|uniref:hypothetical protein n=1 Tax=Lacrimispora sp. TaxID=2719234 RepID=UPI0028B03F28
GAKAVYIPRNHFFHCFSPLIKDRNSISFSRGIRKGRILIPGLWQLPLTNPLLLRYSNNNESEGVSNA